MTAKILIVDDNRNIRIIVKLMLEAQGFQVIEAEDGQKALDLIGEVHPDLVVLDVMMPGLDGYEVCSRLRADETLRKTPVIMLSAKTGEEDKFLGREMGADVYLTKPFDPEELETTILRTLEASRKGEALHPLTGLPMWEAVKHELASRQERHEAYQVMEANIEEETFDTYQKRYGSFKADDAINAVGNTLKSVVAGHPGFFIGHAGNNVFFVIGNPDEMEEVTRTMAPLMQETIRGLYDGDDREAGYIGLRQADGTERKIPLMSWSWRMDKAA